MTTRIIGPPPNCLVTVCYLCTGQMLNVPVTICIYIVICLPLKGAWLRINVLYCIVLYCIVLYCIAHFCEKKMSVSFKARVLLVENQQVARRGRSGLEHTQQVSHEGMMGRRVGGHLEETDKHCPLMHNGWSMDPLMPPCPILRGLNDW